MQGIFKQHIILTLHYFLQVSFGKINHKHFEISVNGFNKLLREQANIMKLNIKNI